MILWSSIAKNIRFIGFRLNSNRYSNSDFINKSLLEISIIPSKLSIVNKFVSLESYGGQFFLTDIFGVEYPGRKLKRRMQVNYLLLSLALNMRLRIVVTTNGITPLLSQTKIYPSSNWLEREVWDMFGVRFQEHPDLRRILTDYGFSGYPLRKSFPLTGYVEVRYDLQKKRIIQKPLSLVQDFRSQYQLTPWLKSTRN